MSPEIEKEVLDHNNLEAELVRQARRFRSEIEQRDDQIRKLRESLDFTQSIDSANVKAAEWASPAIARNTSGVVTVMLTDTHFEENVDPDQIDHLNAYSREIAEKRLKRWADKTIVLARDYVKGIDYDGCVLMIGGDLFSGNIHAELKESNAGTLFEGVLYWLSPLESAIRELANEFGKLHIAAVVGNHGRMTHKPIAKNRAQDNVEWLMYRFLARQTENDPRITWQISDAADALVSVYNTNYLLTHGDQFRGGSGIAGMMSPVMLGQHRKTRRQMAANKPYDWLVMGHWHQYWHGKNIIVGGTMKGYDEYAYVSNFEPEPPIQAFWITDPRHGPTIAAPVHVSDRTDEGW